MAANIPHIVVSELNAKQLPQRLLSVAMQNDGGKLEDICSPSGKYLCGAFHVFLTSFDIPPMAV
jgi:hypothetical protein